MANTHEPPGWTSQFREILLDIDGDLYDLRSGGFSEVLAPTEYHQAQDCGERLRAAAAAGLVYPSVRNSTGECVGLFYPDLASHVVQGAHLDYHWNGTRVDLFRESAKGKVFRIL
jgi:hypothetical protein